MDFSGQHPACCSHRDSGGDPALEARNPNHVELVEIAGEDREEFGALQQGKILILGKFEDSLVERQPGQFAVDEAVFGEH